MRGAQKLEAIVCRCHAPRYRDASVEAATMPGACGSEEAVAGVKGRNKCSFVKPCGAFKVSGVIDDVGSRFCDVLFAGAGLMEDVDFSKQVLVRQRSPQP